MLHGTDLCSASPEVPPARSQEDLASYCLNSGRSAAQIVESKLADLGPAVSANGRFEVGYTLQVPLLKLLVSNGSGWQVDQRAVERLALTVKETNRSVVLYLFSTHFGVKAPIEEYLSKNPQNMSTSTLGTMPKDNYSGIDIYPWTFASTDNDITRYREAVVDRFLAAVCRLPEADRSKVRAVTVLGELHHFYADFERGMSVTGPYIVSDYSEASVSGFREFLAQRFGKIDSLNRLVGEDFTSFAEVDPPNRDIRTHSLRRFTEHIDSFAHGKLPLIGWAFDSSHRQTQPVWIRIYLNGSMVGRVSARYGRRDVLQAKPSIGTPDVGWRFDLDFTQLPPGVYRLDFLAERASGALASLGSRRVSIMDRSQSTPKVLPSTELPQTSDAGGLEGYVDHPPDLASFFYNPLVPLWHEFRNAQVVRYLAHFEHQVRASCLHDVALYTHQITPFTNPSWDTTKFAVDGSLNDPDGLLLGVSLYGEPTYGSSFLDWLASTSHRSYGITEFHPLREMSPEEVREMFGRHRQRGAKFLSFFMDVRPQGVREESERNIYAIDPSNRDFGSDRLYNTIRTVVNE